MTGRWPANVILSPEMAEVLDGQSGVSKSKAAKVSGGHGQFFLDGCHNIEELRRLAANGEKTPKGRDARATLARYESKPTSTQGHTDEGGASRYFLTAGYEQWELEWIYSVGLKPCGTEK